MKIHVLDSDTINQIAAGEVVERPSSVVKELVENAMDAGAGAVTVEIKEGGVALIRVTDNGAGIPKEEIPMAFCRHATSKLFSADDLLRISSMGFRGEALSSIAAVAMVELITKTRDSFTGCRYVIEGGEEKGMTEIGAPEGTTFLVRNLFYNVPARRKFLKSAMTEAGYISELMERFAVSHPDIAFKFINNGKTILQTSGNGSMRDCIYHIYGREVTAALLEVNFVTEALSVSGFIGKPVISRGNRNYENYFVNGRYIRSNIISKAIEEAYKPYTMQHKYPFTALVITVPPDKLDVNVHPTKLEVRFTESEALYRGLFHTIADTLAGKNMIPDAVLSETKKEQKVLPPTPEPFEHNRITYTKEALRTHADEVREKAIEATLKTNLFEMSQKEIGKQETIVPITTKPEPEKTESTEPKRTPGSKNETGKTDTEQTEVKQTEIEKTEIAQTEVRKTEAGISEPGMQGMRIPEERKLVRETSGYHVSDNPQQLSFFEAAEQTKEAFLTKNALDEHRIIGQLFGTYWLIEYEEQLFLIDQHAAHEKILYEHTIKRMKKKEPMSQLVSPPIILALSIRESEIMKQYLDYFQTLGFEIEEFGGREYSVRAIPAELYGVDGQTLLIDMLDELAEQPVCGTSELILNRIATMSCKAAVKGNMRLSQAEARALIEELLTLDNPFHCPHGRPVIVSMSKQEIERKFKRIVN